jgi:hypothetical protein
MEQLSDGLIFTDENESMVGEHELKVTGYLNSAEQYQSGSITYQVSITSPCTSVACLSDSDGNCVNQGQMSSVSLDDYFYTGESEPLSFDTSMYVDPPMC